MGQGVTFDLLDTPFGWDFDRLEIGRRDNLHLVNPWSAFIVVGCRIIRDVELGLEVETFCISGQDNLSKSLLCHR